MSFLPFGLDERHRKPKCSRQSFEPHSAVTAAGPNRGAFASAAGVGRRSACLDEIGPTDASSGASKPRSTFASAPSTADPALTFALHSGRGALGKFRRNERAEGHLVFIGRVCMHGNAAEPEDDHAQQDDAHAALARLWPNRSGIAGR